MHKAHRQAAIDINHAVMRFEDIARPAVGFIGDEAALAAAHASAVMALRAARHGERDEGSPDLRVEANLKP